MAALAYLQQLPRPVWSIISIEYPLLVLQKPRHSNKIGPESHWGQKHRGDWWSVSSYWALTDSRANQLKSGPSLGETNEAQTGGSTEQGCRTARDFTATLHQSVTFQTKTTGKYFYLWYIVLNTRDFCDAGSISWTFVPPRHFRFHLPGCQSSPERQPQRLT